MLSAIEKELLHYDTFVLSFAFITMSGIIRYQTYYCNRYHNTNLVLCQKCTYEDVCRLLEWESNEIPLNIGGYKYDKKTKTFPVFINYDKAETIQDTIKYEDHF